MSQHHFSATGRNNAPIDVVVGLAPQHRGFFIELFRGGQNVPYEKHKALPMVADVERTLSSKGIRLHGKIANALEDELNELDFAGSEIINKRVHFYSQR